MKKKKTAARPRAKITPWTGEPIELPDDCVYLLMTYLSPRDLAPLTSVSKRFAEMLAQPLWAGALAKAHPLGVCLLEFPLPMESPMAA